MTPREKLFTKELLGKWRTDKTCSERLATLVVRGLADNDPFVEPVYAAVICVLVEAKAAEIPEAIYEKAKTKIKVGRAGDNDALWVRWMMLGDEKAVEEIVQNSKLQDDDTALIGRTARWSLGEWCKNDRRVAEILRRGVDKN